MRTFDCFVTGEFMWLFRQFVCPAGTALFAQPPDEIRGPATIYRPIQGGFAVNTLVDTTSSGHQLADASLAPLKDALYHDGICTAVLLPVITFEHRVMQRRGPIFITLTSVGATAE